MPWTLMEVTQLLGVFLHISFVLLCLLLRLVVLRLTIFSLPFFIWVGDALNLLVL
jgi:hypothetical protein